MSENEILVEQTENTEQTVEETPVPKMYSQEEVDAIVGKAKARTKAKVEKQYEKEYGELRDVLKAGMGKESVGEITSDLREFYGNKKGIKMPEKSAYSARDTVTLAKADAEEIIGYGDDDVVEELDRLTQLGVANMSGREKAMYEILCNHLKESETVRELSKIGVTEDVYNSQEFKEFAGKFNANTPITDIYDIYNKTKPRKEIKTMGSMKTNTPQDNGVKDFYTRDEALKFTKDDFDKNPALFEAVVKSSQSGKW